MQRMALAGGLGAMTTVPLIYVECDVPEGQTLDEFRRSTQHHGRRRHGWRRVLRRR